MSRREKYRFIENFKLTGIHSAGRSYGRLGARTIYIDFTIPDELVDIKIPKRQKGYAVGFLERIIEPSPNRAQPFCKHFQYCGGCNWQHIGYSHQLELKRQMLANALSKYEIATPEIPHTVSSPQLQYYRNKLEYAFSVDEKEQPTLGFHPYDKFNRVVQIDECFLQPEPSRRIAETAKALAVEMDIPFYNQQDGSGVIRSLTIRTTNANEVMVAVGFTPNGAELRIPYLQRLHERLPEVTSLYFCQLADFKSSYASSDLILYSGATHLHEKMGRFTFRLSAKSFFQPNRAQAQAIYQAIVDVAHFTPNDLVYDLYTGVGSIACYVAPKVGKVIGIEGTPEAINDACYNAEQNGITNAAFLAGDILETFKPAFVARHGKPDVIVLDPPRSGTLIEIKRTIVEAQPRKIIYLSCNPVSLAFDLKMLTNGYHVSYIQPFDMFPHTHHVETLVVLERKDIAAG